MKIADPFYLRIGGEIGRRSEDSAHVMRSRLATNGLIAGSSPALCTMIDVYDIIKQINERKKSVRMEPSSALFSEVSEEVHKKIKKEINELCKDGKLEFHRTINDLSFDAK